MQSVVPPSPVKEYCKATFAFESTNEDELTLQDGDVIQILSKVSKATLTSNKPVALAYTQWRSLKLLLLLLFQQSPFASQKSFQTDYMTVFLVRERGN